MFRKSHIRADDLIVGSEISWWFRNILPLGSGLIGMVPKYPAARARINRNGSDSSGSEISCDTGPLAFCHVASKFLVCENSAASAICDAL